MKIGFIDYYLDEWHANAYPKMIREASGGEVEVVYAYGQIASPLTGRDSEAWCIKRGLTLCTSIEEVIEKSDALVVLSPDNCEMKEELSRLALQSGKRVYVDKTFAPDRKTAEGMFALAQQYHTPCYSTSALRFADEYQPYLGRKIQAMSLCGPNEMETYSVHQLEPLMMLMQGSVRRVMTMKEGGWVNVMLEWEDGRNASIVCTGSEETPFAANILTDTGSEYVKVESSFFERFIENLVAFFRTGEIPVAHEQTVEIMAVRAAILKAMDTPAVWVPVE